MNYQEFSFTNDFMLTFIFFCPSKLEQLNCSLYLDKWTWSKNHSILLHLILCFQPIRFYFFDSNYSTKCTENCDKNTAEVVAVLFAMEQAKRLNIQKVRICTEYNHMIADSVNAKKRILAHFERSRRDVQPMENRREYKDFDDETPRGFVVKTKAIRRGNEHHNAASELARQGASS